MCTILVRHNPADPYPLAILANRDETYKRSSGGWHWRGGDRQYFAPIDHVAGGSWIGLNREGLVVALTNIFPNAEIKNPRSRGVLVVDALGFPSAADAEDGLADNIIKWDYNNFNLLIADPISAFVVSWKDQQLAINHLLPGLYAIVNTLFTARGDDNLDPPNNLWITDNDEQLCSHPQVCRHGEDYGTRCSHKILVGKAGVEKQVWHLEGHPCEGEFIKVLSEEQLS